LFEDSQLSFLLWNLFLAWVPLLILYVVGALPKRLLNKFVAAALVIMWAIFYPNAPYMITALLHTPLTIRQIGLSVNILSWLKFSIMFISFWLGILLTYYSLYPIHSNISSKVSKTVGTAAIIFISFISAYGIYLGRFPRLNSWDLFFNPSRVISIIRSSFNLDTLVFVLLFGLMIYLIYTSLYRIKHNK